MPQTSADRDAQRRRVATSMLATELVGDVAMALASAQISVMPVKGALLQHWLYQDPADRPLSDVDILVRPQDFRRAIARLGTRGYRRVSGSGVGAVVMQTPLGLALDLHPRLFDRARYRISTDGVFARSTEDRELFGASVRLPSPLDAYAHLIGKFGSDHLDASATARLDEIARMARRLEARPEIAGRHLMHCGMGRVARYVLPLVQEITGDGFAMRVHDCLPADPVGRALVFIANRGLAGATPEASSGALIAHLLNDSLPRGARSGIRALVQRARRA